MEEISQNSQENSKMQRFKEGAKSVFYYAFLIVVVFFCGMGLSFLVYSHYRFQYVSGTSMQPTFNPDVLYPDSIKDDYPEDLKKQDVVLIKVTKDVHAGEVVIVQVPGAEDTYIKRILAEDGDMITMIKTDPDQWGRSLYYTYVIKAGTEEPILLDESYIPYTERIYWTQDVSSTTYNNVTYEGYFYDCYFNPNESHRKELKHSYDKDKIVTVSLNGKDVMFYKLGEDEIFFAGDHRRNSKDSRIIGTLQRKDIVGKSIAVIQDAVYYDEKNTLWWQEIKTFFKSMWQEAINFFDW